MDAIAVDRANAGQTAAATSIDGAQKSLLRFITCGSVDDGKSTLIGRMLHDSGVVFDDQMEALEKDSQKFGTQGDRIDFALLVDGLSAEREQGITIDVAYRYFSTSRRSFIVADTPGHEQYTRNMATGASTAELAIILIDARKGVLPQTRRHSFIVSMLGVREVVIAINKMDLVGYSQQVYDKIVADYSELAKRLNFGNIVFVPVSALEGDNVTKPSSAMPWYRGTTLIGHLETVDIKPSSAADGAFTFPVQWVNRPNLDFRGYAGWMTHGRVAQGDPIVALPSGRRSTIARIVTYDGDLSEASAGQALTLTLADEIDVSRGDVIVSANYSGKPRSLVPARILWMSERPLADGSTYFLKLGAATAQAKISVSRAVDIHTYEEGEAQRLNMNEIGIAAITLDRPIVASEYAEDRELGGFILIDRWTNETMALGLVDSSLSPKVASDAAAQVVPAGVSGRLATFMAAELPLRRQTRGDIFRRVLLGFAPLAVIIGGILGALSGSLLLGLGVAVAHLVACALLSLWMHDSGVAVDESRLRDEVNVDGDGI